MQENEIWKLLQNWIAMREKKNTCSFLEHIASLNEQNEKLKTQNLELFYEEQTSIEEAIFFIIEPYYVKMYQGLVKEKNGSLEIENYVLLKQVSCDSIQIPYVIGRTIDHENPFDIIASLTTREAYILDGLTKGSLNYYQEKDIDGLYGRILETTQFIKIGKPKKYQKLSRRLQMIPCKNLNSLEGIALIQDGSQIIPIVKERSSESYLVAIDVINSILDRMVEKVYQLL